jgi:hypothetical protein
MTQETSLAVTETQSADLTQVSLNQVRFAPEYLEECSLANAESLPDLSTGYEVEPMAVNIGYWTPENIGEKFNGFVVEMTTEMMPKYGCPDEEKHILFPVECITLVKMEDGKMKQYRVSQKVLVSNIKSGVRAGRIVPYSFATPLVITYLGEHKNKTNQNKSHHFEIEILRRVIKG